MNDDELMAPMDHDLRALLRKGDSAVPAGAQDRVQARLQVTLPLLPGGGGGGGGAGGAGSAIATSKIAAIVAASLIAGGGVGAAITTAARPAEVRIVYVDRPATSAVAVASAIPEPSSARVEDLPSAIASTKPATSAKPTASDSPMNAERALLDRARTSFAHGEQAAALAALDEHRAKYPSGVLAEEREALAVRTLAALGRSADARARAARFAARYPSSLMLPAVESAIGATDSGATPP